MGEREDGEIRQRQSSKETLYSGRNTKRRLYVYVCVCLCGCLFDYLFLFERTKTLPYADRMFGMGWRNTARSTVDSGHLCSERYNPRKISVQLKDISVCLYGCVSQFVCMWVYLCPHSLALISRLSSQSSLQCQPNYYIDGWCSASCNIVRSSSSEAVTASSGP